MNHKIVTRAALLLALTLLFQSLRLIIPVPPMISVFLIGSLVNACLIIGARTIGFWPVTVISVAAPVVAYFQQQLPIPVFIVPVAAGNVILAGALLLLERWGRWRAVVIAAALKAGFLLGAFSWLLTFVAIPPKAAMSIMFVMSWPQLVTAIIGGMIAETVLKRVQNTL